MDFANVRGRGRNPSREKHQLGALDETTGGGVDVSEVRRCDRNPSGEKHQQCALEETTGVGVSVLIEGGSAGATPGRCTN